MIRAAATVFAATEVVEIVGAVTETECSHCGRRLKVGVKLDQFAGCFGADCLAKAFAPYRYGGRKYRHGADTIRQRGIIAMKGAACMARHGLGPEHFRFVLAQDLHSI